MSVKTSDHAVAARLAAMYVTDEERELARRDRHKRWIAELTDQDWERIRALARQVTDEYEPARLDDLDAGHIAVGVCRAGDERWTSGERIGAVCDGKVAVLVWEK